jgi:hypothetical protein
VGLRTRRRYPRAGGRTSLLVSQLSGGPEGHCIRRITGAVGKMARDPKVGHAEAMRRSMLVDKGANEETHPGVLAPVRG